MQVFLRKSNIRINTNSIKSRVRSLPKKDYNILAYMRISLSQSWFKINFFSVYNF